MSLIYRLKKLQEAHGLHEADVEDLEDAIDKIESQASEIDDLKAESKARLEYNNELLEANYDLDIVMRLKEEIAQLKKEQSECRQVLIDYGRHNPLL